MAKGTINLELYSLKYDDVEIDLESLPTAQRLLLMCKYNWRQAGDPEWETNNTVEGLTRAMRWSDGYARKCIASGERYILKIRRMRNKFREWQASKGKG